MLSRTVCRSKKNGRGLTVLKLDIATLYPIFALCTGSELSV